MHLKWPLVNGAPILKLENKAIEPNSRRTKSSNSDEDPNAAPPECAAPCEARRAQYL